MSRDVAAEALAARTRNRNRIAEALPILMLVVDGGAVRRGWSRLSGAVEAGVNVLQLRDPSLDTSALTELAVSLGAAFRGRTLVAVNTDVNAAMAGGADGLHLRESVETPSLPETMFVSRAVHSVEAAMQAEREGADMLVLGTIFPSKSHPGGTTTGLGGVRTVCDAVRVPVIGIGGITADDAGDVIRAGASGVAVISAILGAPDARAAAAALRATIDGAWRER